MSHVVLLASDRPLPLYDPGVRRIRTSGCGGHAVTGEEDGFSVREHCYCRDAVDELGFSMKPCRYELDLRATQQDTDLLRGHLERNLAPGEQAELWSVWVPRCPEDGLARYRGRLEELDLETVELLEQWNVCITVEA